MKLFHFIRRSPGVFVVAMAVTLVMLVFSELAYWRSVRTVDALVTSAATRTGIQSVRQNLLVAMAALRGYRQNNRPEYLASYQRVSGEIDHAFAALRALYAQSPAETEVLGELQRVSDLLRERMADNLRRHTANQVVVPEDADDVQMGAVQRFSDELMELEAQGAAVSRADIYRTLLLSRIGLALLGLATLLALVKYLRQTLALDQQRREVERMVQAERDRLEVEVQLRTRQLTELTQHLQTAREDERHRLARNLHDDLGALLTSAKLDTARLRSRLPDAPPEALELLAHLVATLNDGIALGRRIIEDLRPSALSNLGLVAALDILAGEFAAHSGVQVHRQLRPVMLRQSAELVIYRLVQEAITNISKYAHARQVWLTLGEADGFVEIAVRDDGAGFDPRHKRNSAYGLVGMRYRVESEGGTLSVRSAPGQGTLIQVRLPLSEPTHAATEPAPL